MSPTPAPAPSTSTAWARSRSCGRLGALYWQAMGVVVSANMLGVGFKLLNLNNQPGTYAVDTGAGGANALVATLTPPISSIRPATWFGSSRRSRTRRHRRSTSTVSARSRSSARMAARSPPATCNPGSLSRRASTGRSSTVGAVAVHDRSRIADQGDRARDDADGASRQRQHRHRPDDRQPRR